MECHMNCHGELNALFAAIPFAAVMLARFRVYWRTWRAAR